MTQYYAIIVEDDQQNAEVISRMLHIQGFRTTVVRFPTEIEAVLRAAQDVNIIFVDLAMPTMNGYSVLEKIRQNPNYDGVPVVACTVYTDEINNAYERGFHSFIAKPLRIESFQNHVQRILANERVWDRSS